MHRMVPSLDQMTKGSRGRNPFLDPLQHIFTPHSLELFTKGL